MINYLHGDTLQEQFKKELQELFKEVMNTDEEYMRSYLLNKGITDLIANYDEAREDD